MKGIGVAFAAGLLGTLIGSLAAQAPGTGIHHGDGSRGYLSEGDIEVLRWRLPDLGDVETLESGNARVYENWVLVDGTRFIPREQVQMLKLRSGEEQGAARDFGDDPKPTRPGRPDTFREDN